jgi:hypothetical protein
VPFYLSTDQPTSVRERERERVSASLVQQFKCAVALKSKQGHVGHVGFALSQMLSMIHLRGECLMNPVSQMAQTIQK